METRIGAESHHFYGLSGSDLRGLGKRSVEWDLNDWKWDGDLFIANPSQFLPHGSMIPVTGVSSNSSSSCSDEVNPVIEKAKRELEKRRRVIVVEDDSNLDEEGGSLSLKLGGHGFQVVDEREVVNCGKKSKLVGVTSNRAVCQVEDCVVDLSNAKDYHRRHKVCEMHAKATRALVGNAMQRFCQQCSRFHLLQEFDEGKRSCRRRLAGHNKRRRKTQPESSRNGSALNDDQASSYLLISLLKILTNMHSNGTEQTNDQDLLSQLLKSLSNHGGAYGGGGNISGFVQDSQDLHNPSTSVQNPEKASPLLRTSRQYPPRPIKHAAASSPETAQKGLSLYEARNGDIQSTSSKPDILFPVKNSLPEVRKGTAEGVKLNNFDLNDIYIDSDDNMEDSERSPMGPGSLECPSWVQQDSHQSSPPQASANSDSASDQSPSSSSGDAQNRTDRIVFKLFGKEPNDFPLVLRAQILDWLSNSPTEIESYIRPGCIILIIYIRLAQSGWEELRSNLSCSLSRLLDVSDDNSFWRTGWVYIRVQHQVAFIYNGQVVLDRCLPLKSNYCSKISSIKPIAVSLTERAEFSVKGFNLFRPTTRLLCGLEANYLIQEATNNLIEDHSEGIQSLKFSCSIPTVSGRGFVEVEDDGLPSCFFPFIVAERDVCTEIRTLESAIELVNTDDVWEETGKMEAKHQAIDFIHEIGWLLHRCHLKSRLGDLDPNPEAFSLKRFRWLMEFSMDRDWCAVVKKLLDVSIGGNVGPGEHASLMVSLSEMGLVHKAVRRNCRALVELLLRYVPEKLSDEHKLLFDGSFLFKPDATGPAGLTPLHIAAGIDGSDDVLDALTEDPGSVGIEAWKSARDSTGFTPEDYARLRGHYSYIHLVQKKLNKKPMSTHVVLDIPRDISEAQVNQKENPELCSSNITGLEIAQARPRPIQRNCKLCAHKKMAYGNASRPLVYRPAMLSMVAIAAVCVCVALVLKTSPQVLYVFQPFSWDLLDFGTS